MGERERRIGANEATFRKVNEQIEQVNEAFGVITKDFLIVCECGDAGCAEQIHVTPGEYEDVRADSTLFFIRPGHDIPDVEDAVTRTDRYWVVRKHEGDPAQLARELDDRRG